MASHEESGRRIGFAGGTTTGWRILARAVILWPLVWLVTMLLPALPLKQGDDGPTITYVPLLFAYYPRRIWWIVVAHAVGSFAVGYATILLSHVWKRRA